MVDMSEWMGRIAVITGAALGMGLCAFRKLCAASSPASDACRCVIGSTHVFDCGRLTMKPEPLLFGAL